MNLNKKNFVIFSLLLVAILYFFATTPVYAANENSKVNSVIYLLDGGCKDSLLGDPEDTDSVAWIVYELLKFLRFIGPIVVVVLSSIEFIPIIMSGDSEAMPKVQRNLMIRIILAVSLYFIPYLIIWLLELFEITSSGMCGIS